MEQGTTIKPNSKNNSNSSPDPTLITDTVVPILKLLNLGFTHFKNVTFISDSLIGFKQFILFSYSIFCQKALASCIYSSPTSFGSYYFGQKKQLQLI